MLELLDTLGQASGEALWVPVLAWTALWLAAEAALRLGARLHPLVRYRAAQAVLLALPLGLAAAPLLDAGALADRLRPPEVVTLEAAPLALAMEGTPVVTAAPPEPLLTPWMALGALTVLVAGFALVGLWRLGRQALALSRLRRLLPAPEAADRGARVVTTAAAPVPMTFGLWRPVIVLPAGLSPEARALALRHERVHVQRRDALSAWLEGLTAAVFGAHPGVRRLAQECGLLRELACDAALLAEPAVSRSAYATLVSRFAAPETRGARLSPAVGMADSPSHIHQRITAMTTPRPLLRRSSAVLGGALAALVLVSASLAVTASRALAQEQRVIVRTVESADPPVIIVDGVRTEGSLDDVAPGDIHSVEVLKGDAARDEFGAESVIRITTKAEAERLGLETPEAELRAFTLGVDQSSGTVLLDGESLNHDTRARLEARLGELRAPLLRLHAEVEGPMMDVFNEVSPQLLRLSESAKDPNTELGELMLRLQEGVRDESTPIGELMLRLREGVQDENTPLGEVVQRLSEMSDDEKRERFGFLIQDQRDGGSELSERLRRADAWMEELDEGATNVRVTIRDRDEIPGDDARLGVFTPGDGPAIRLGEMGDVFASGIASISIERDGDGRLVTLTMKDGTTRELRLAGFISTAVTAADLTPAVNAKTGEASGAVLAEGAFPNPAADRVTVRLAMDEPGTARFRLYDLTGRLVRERDVSHGEALSLSVDVSGLAPGGYIYRIETGTDGVKTGRFSVVR